MSDYYEILIFSYGIKYQCTKSTVTLPTPPPTKKYCPNLSTTNKQIAMKVET